MKKEFRECPSAFDGRNMYGFNWKEHVTAIPSPLCVVTTYKENGNSNATLQSWFTFSNDDDFYCIFGSVNKGGHMYKTIKQTSSLVINFPSLDNYYKCYQTIANNKEDNDEILASGLTIESSSVVDAPRIKECFLNLECSYVWEKELYPNSNSVVMCVKVVNVIMDDSHFDCDKSGRYGKTGYLYNIHSPFNPENGKEESTYVGTIDKTFSYEDLGI